MEDVITFLLILIVVSVPILCCVLVGVAMEIQDELSSSAVERASVDRCPQGMPPPAGRAQPPTPSPELRQGLAWRLKMWGSIPPLPA